MLHEFRVRVYYEDTDMAGIVYHANYLKFIERARSDWVRGMGIDQNALRDNEGVVFVIRRIEADFRASARFDDELTVTTRVQAVSGVRLTLHQEVRRAGEVVFSADVVLVSVTLDGQPVRLPEQLRRRVH
ncbi:MAG: tol-pal system-associated acyl-CoA thioesterase [Rhodobacteraceae bacterium]|jgi:acyl-CoA thioester hydrolase|uniref:Acyl-CoA thioester hydrolase n=1 Tax=Salipiger profundus TaxID=1229727 RepID=A0A1U7D2D2_9RHOB|nr:MULTISPECIES: tol-pal system-associated acyl-CoA thioesterase [Salipiger]APX22324.1 acyl-CoA thioester hydrolase [Salipiger profundus]MAB05609.1 tol-pal system-associated acyl-CoA thioesterase [Paracoccaceae bacterium]GGA22389.1 tol-pal system-associated acyl-CoA thioesterase [Salipiger profundus]SFD67042.1 acyl-CoA thioester hydrolase [Salipiger profundus]